MPIGAIDYINLTVGFPLFFRRGYAMLITPFRTVASCTTDTIYGEGNTVVVKCTVNSAPVTKVVYRC